MHMFTRCLNGLGVVGGRRDTAIQENFRKELTMAQKAEHTSFETEASLRCPIIRDWVHKGRTTATHLPLETRAGHQDKIFRERGGARDVFH